MKQSGRAFEALFDIQGAWSESKRGGVVLQRTRTIHAGDTLEIESYPVWDHKSTGSICRREMEKHREAVRRVHMKRRVKQLRRLINNNFTDGDVLMTLTYRLDEQPEDERSCLRDIQNYIRRVKTKRERMGLASMKYVYTIERTESEKYGTRYHAHMIMSGGIDRDELERMWKRGQCNTKRAQRDNHALSGWAHYMSKQKLTQEKAMKRGWNCSKNLTKPFETVADKKITPRKAEKIAREAQEEGKKLLCKLYPGFELTEDIEVRSSTWCPGVYLSAQLRRRDG